MGEPRVVAIRRRAGPNVPAQALPRDNSRPPVRTGKQASRRNGIPNANAAAQRMTPGPLYLVGKRNNSPYSESNPSSRPVPKSKAPVGSKPSPRLATSDPKPRSFVRIPIEKGRPKAAVHQSACDAGQAFLRRKAVNEHGKRLELCWDYLGG